MRQPKVILTMIVRDEEDIVETSLRYHRAMGVDEAIVIDHGSRDATPDILAELRQEGWLTVIRRDAPAGASFPHGRWATELARLAFAERGAEWIVQCDGDEFWWPVVGDLRTMFALAPRGTGLIHAVGTDFVAREGEGDFVDRLVVRERWARNRIKTAYRGQDDLEVSVGSHTVTGRGLAAGPYWPARILHFPIRSRAQLEKRAGRWGSRGEKRWESRLRWDEDGSAHLDGVRIFYDDESIAAGLEAGVLVEDTRLRTFLRTGESPPVDSDAEYAAIRQDVTYASVGEVGRRQAPIAKQADRALARVEKLKATLAEIQSRQGLWGRLGGIVRRGVR